MSRMHKPPHPGAILKADVLPELGLSVTEAARQLGNALRKALAGINPEQVFLFGSRVDDRARGGDIDVLVFSRADPLRLSRGVATRFFME